MSNDVRAMTDQKLVDHVTKQPEVTVLENELKHRLEAYIAVHGALGDGCVSWE